MHDSMFTLLSVFRVSRLCGILSSDRFCRSCITLHAYVQVTSNPPFYKIYLLIFLQSSTLNQGVSSHKKIPKEQSWILRQYYGNNIVLFLFCACNELFFVSIYLLSFPPPPNSPPRLGMLPWNTKRARANRCGRLHPRHTAILSLSSRIHHIPDLCGQELDQCNPDGQCSPRSGGSRQGGQGRSGTGVIFSTKKVNCGDQVCEENMKGHLKKYKS